MTDEKWNRIQITFEPESGTVLTEEESDKLIDAAVSAAREALGPIKGSLMRWTACKVPKR